MASGRYKKGKKKLLDADIDLLVDTIKAVLIDTGTYTVNLTSHEFYSDLSGVVGTPVTMTGKSTTNGIFDADDVTFSAVTGSTPEAVVIYKDTGTTTTSPLIAYIDGITGLPITPNGGDIVVQWDNGANKIFAD